MRFPLLIALFSIVWSSAASAASATFSWTANPPTNLAGYRIYFGTSTGPPYAATGSPVEIPLAVLADVNSPSFTVEGLPSCGHFFFVATAYDVAGGESDYTPEVETTVVDAPAGVTVGPAAQPGAVSIDWTTGLPAGDSGSVAGYRVHYDTVPVADGDPYAGTGAIEGDSPIETAGPLALHGLASGQAIYVAVEALCADGVASKRSAGASVVVPGPSCGNGTVEVGETCDPPSSCPQSCDDGIACTVDSLTGSAASCSVSCSHAPITACAPGDGCCPAGCDSNLDGDCSASCGNGTVEAGETCDPPSSCPQICDDGIACTVDSLTGSAANCSVSCSHAPITACAPGDGCCPAGCDSNLDGDCSASCGNGTIEVGESCDPPSSCPQSCDDGIACTGDILVGSKQSCGAACSHAVITSCIEGDGCCPAGCEDLDSDCGAVVPQRAVIDRLALEGGCAVAAAAPASIPAVGLLLLALVILLGADRRRRHGRA